MKKLSSKSWAARCLIVLTVAAPLLAFVSPLRGGDSFEIYLGKTRLVQQFVHLDKSTKTLDLASATANDVLKVSFNHCGQTSTNRTLSLKSHATVLKQWKFSDMKAGASPEMVISITEIRSIQKANKGIQLSLYYTSDMLKDGRVLAAISQYNEHASIR